ncbi:MAG: hypothetical protein QXO75_07240, partial [Nitrososphaerota archaeon]
MGFLVKRVREKIYVYEYMRLTNWRKVERYIKSLKELVRNFQASQFVDNSPESSYQRLTPSISLRIAEYVVNNLIEDMKKLVDRPG